MDLAWQPSDSDRLAAQWLLSDTLDPILTQQAADAARGIAWKLSWQRTSDRFDWALYDTRIDADLRADAGSMPSADIDEQFAKVGVRFFDVSFLNELKPRLRVYGDIGRLVDYGTGELRDGYQLRTSVLLRPTQQIELETELAWVRLDDRQSGASVVREDNATLTAIYHFSAVLNIYERGIRMQPVSSAESSTTATLVLSYRPSWRTTAFVGVSRLPRDATGIDELASRVFLKVSHSFGT